MYLANTSLVTGAASLQMGLNPLRFWWMGTKENGLTELSLFAFGFLGAMAYLQSPWTIAALIIPVAIIYVAFSRLAGANVRLEALQGQIATDAKLASIGAISLDLAHQINNPLTILLGRLESLLDRAADDSRLRRLVDSAASAGWRIQELAKNFTTLGHQRPVDLDVHSLLDEAYGVAGLFHATTAEAQWDYQEDQPRISGYPVLLREAMSNIFSNAMEAVAEDGLIATTVSHSDGTVTVHISDNGPGIPEATMEHLFEPFQSTKQGGIGLGLFAVKHIVEMHSGSVSVETEEGRGTSVTVTLPAEAHGRRDRTDTTFNGQSQREHEGV